MQQIKKIPSRVSKAVIFLLILALLVDKELFVMLLKYKGYIIPKVIILVQMFIYSNEVFAILKKLPSLLPKIVIEIDEAPRKDGKTIDGIDTHSLVDLLFKTKRIGYEEIREKFGLSPQKYKILGDNLEKNGLIERGKNNARVLKEGLQKQTVLNHLLKFSKSSDASPLLRRSGQTAVVV